jgi:hypothetical protein
LNYAAASNQFGSPEIAPQAATIQPVLTADTNLAVRDPNPRSNGPVRIAVISFLFNWPSTGGGNMHTAGLVEFLGRAGTRRRQ